MTTLLNEQATPPSNLEHANTRSHENLITDQVLSKALLAILEIVDTDGRVRARQMREKAGLSLCETIQLLLYLQYNEVLHKAVDGTRTVNLPLVRDYLAILGVPAERPLQEATSKKKQSFTQAQIAWACVHAREGKLTPMRVARPSRWTIALALALHLVPPDAPDTFVLSTGRAKCLCNLVAGMREEEKASYVSWAEVQRSGDEGAERKVGMGDGI